MAAVNRPRRLPGGSDSFSASAAGHLLRFRTQTFRVGDAFVEVFNLLHLDSDASLRIR